MPSFCVIDSCKRVKQVGESISFHKFPIHNQQINDKWIEFVRKNSAKINSERIISRHSSICSQHFQESDFTKTGGNTRKFLKKSAIPTIIPSPKIHHPVEILIEEDPVTYELCGLCRTQSTSYQLHLFDEYSFSLMRKCIPFVTFNLSFMQKICVNCVAILNTFSSFIDKILIAQNIFNQELVQQQNENNLMPFVDNDLRIPTPSRSCHLPGIKVEPMAFEDEPKMPFLKPINFANTTPKIMKLNSSQKKLEILEIVDIKPLNFLPIETNALNCDVSDSYEENECQILSPPQLKVEIAEDGDNELELIKDFVHKSTVCLQDHNYVMSTQQINVLRSVKKESDNEDFEEEIPVESHVEISSYKICCNKKFSSIRNFLLHKIRRHKHLSRKQCTKCSKSFPNDISLKYHKKNHCKSQLNQYKKAIEILKEKSKKISRVPSKRKKIHSCPICKKLFKGPKNLYQHKLSHLASNNSCHICNKVFKRKHGLRQHIKAQHEKQKQFHCLVCNHHYALKGDLKRCKHRDLKKKC